jgi:hypothetical protein
MSPGQLILAIGVALVAANTWMGARDPVAIQFPVSLRVGETLSVPFSTDYQGEHEVALEVERVLGFERTMCLMGLSEFLADAPTCAETDASPDLQWELLSGGQVVASGGTKVGQTGAYSDKIGRQLGTVDLVPRRQYQLRVRSFADGSALEAAKPNMVVAVHPMMAKDGLIRSILGNLGGGALVMLGLALELMVQLRRRRARWA